MPETLSYDLHKLGWRAFQDLSAVILQAVLGQTFHTFADSNDGGRDGAFFGAWLSDKTSSGAGLPIDFGTAGSTVAQCKFSASGVGTLPPSVLEDELEKASALHVRGLCDAYLLMTNLRVTGETEAWLRKELQSRGIQHVQVLDGTWICQQISSRPHLRRYVPRVYGLGDLGQILDERRLEQAKALLSSLGEDLATFVPTASYRQAADALADHGFTLLLGAPAAGKSTIAATLATAALDEWGCGVRRVDSAAELVETWNTNEADQLFWVDDAFGAIRHDPQLTDQWARRMDQVMAAVKNGAKVILTSRDYIYRQARVHLKEYAYPLLREQTVVVDVAQLSDDEKGQILYNHLRAGDQSGATLRAWRQHLPAVATSKAFQPEIARRLGHQAFTSKIRRDQLLDYVEHQVDFLKDVLDQLEPSARAALACVYLAGDGLSVPFVVSPQLREAIMRIGSTESDLASSFQSLDGTFLALTSDVDGDTRWRFRHPTIREGFAASIAGDPNAVNILIDGLTDSELLRQVDCGGIEIGTLVTVPSNLYETVASRANLAAALKSPDWSSPLGAFLTSRCSDSFLRIWARVHDADLSGLLNFSGYFGVSWRPTVLARLKQADALPDSIRRAAVALLERKAIEEFDDAWLDEDVVRLFTPAERGNLLDRFRRECLPQIDDLVSESADGYDSDASPADRYDQAHGTVSAYLAAFEGDVDVSQKLRMTLETISARMQEPDEDYRPASRASFSPTFHDTGVQFSRDQFDDVDAGH